MSFPDFPPSANFPKSSKMPADFSSKLESSFDMPQAGKTEQTGAKGPSVFGDTSSPTKISKSSIMFADLEMDERSTVGKLFDQAQVDNDKQNISGEEEMGNFRSGIIGKFLDNAGNMLNKLGLPGLNTDEIAQLNQLKEAKAEQAKAKEAAMNNPGKLPPKTPDGKLSPDQVKQYMENTPNTHKFRDIIDNSTDFMTRKLATDALKRFKQTLSEWKDTPPGNEGGTLSIENGSMVFTKVKYQTLPDGTKMFNTAEGCFQLGADGYPGKKLDAAGLAKHGYVEQQIENEG